MYIKKNRQLATWAPDYVGCDYTLGADGPCGNGFDCSGLQTYMYAQVGYSYGDTTAQGWYTASTHVTSDNALRGDWLFFDWDNEPPSGTSIDHTGCYTGVNASGHRLMTHASVIADEVVTVDLTTYMVGHTALYGHRYGTNQRF